MTTRPFAIDDALARIATAVAPYPKAAMFELADDGFSSPFEQLIACLLSVRTRDETSLVAARRLFAVARTAADLAALSVAEIDALIPDVTFHERKAPQIQAIAARVRDEFGGELPCDAEVMQSFAGIGPKCAHLALGVACGASVISVDIHVHRVTNRWGYVATSTPERTMLALERVLPERHWVQINALLVPFGKHICMGIRPKCSTCPVLDMCRQVGVTSHR
jgi:endonuclease III